MLLGRSPVRPAVLLAALGLTVSADRLAAAQSPDAPERPPSRPVSVQLGAAGGAIIPLGNLTENRFGFDTNLASTGMFGGELILWHPSGLGLGAEGTYSQMEVNQSAGAQGFVLPGGLGDAEYFAGVIDVRYRYRDRGEASVVQPEWGLGLGFRRINVDPIAEPDLEDSTDLVASGRISVFVRIADRWGLRAGIRATRGSYDAGISDDEISQTDLLVGVGVVVRLY
ncbi:MAG: hypothetical protein ACE5JR_00835 [Gemmatimonadota bacterium]